jgi:hypothetical protein
MMEDGRVGVGVDRRCVVVNGRSEDVVLTRRVVEKDREVSGAASGSRAQFDALSGVEGAGEEEVVMVLNGAALAAVVNRAPVKPQRC